MLILGIDDQGHMQGEIYIHFKRFCKKRKNNSDKSHPFVYAEPLDLIFSLERQSNDYQISMNPEKKKKPGKKYYRILFTRMTMQHMRGNHTRTVRTMRKIQQALIHLHACRSCKLESLAYLYFWKSSGHDKLFSLTLGGQQNFFKLYYKT